jgi:hypothetical protein
MLTRVSILLSIVAAVALLFASDLVIWHVLPRSFQMTGMLAFWLGAALSLLAILFGVVGLVRDGKIKSRVRVCAWSVTEFLAFGLVYLYGLFSA